MILPLPNPPPAAVEPDPAEPAPAASAPAPDPAETGSLPAETDPGPSAVPPAPEPMDPVLPRPRPADLAENVPADPVPTPEEAAAAILGEDPAEDPGALPPPDPDRPADLSLPAAGIGPRIVLHVPAGEPDALVADLAGALAPLAGELEIRVVDLAVARTGVRYFHPADREAAQAVRRAVAVFEGGWEVGLSDFTGYDPPPRDGTVEVWVRPSG